MKKIYCLPFLFVAVVSFAQTLTSSKNPGRESQAYHSYRMEFTLPPYGLKKIESQMETTSYKISDKNSKLYQSLSLREKFTYNMIHGESFYQNCSASFSHAELEEDKKIFSRLPAVFGESAWSEAQRKFFSTNRDSVIHLMKECILKTNRVGLNFKAVIRDINATEMIRFLIDFYQRSKKDHDILTVLMLLMKENNFQPFLNSEPGKKLYGPDSNYSSFISLTPADEALILDDANQFIKQM